MPPSHPRRFRFAINLTQASDGRDWRAKVRAAEDQGYSALLIPDHFNDQLAPFSALAVAAAATKSLKVGLLVGCNDYRSPLNYAKELATLDVLANGRTEWGLGAGWWEQEFVDAGIAFDTAGVRVSRLQESVELMRALFSGEPVAHRGEHYSVTSNGGYPVPTQRPHPPLLIGASEKRMLRFAGAEADIVGVNGSLRTRSLFGQPPIHSPEESLDHQVAWVREGAGDRFDQLELNMVAVPVAITKDREGAAQRLHESTGYDPEVLLTVPNAWIGTVDQICAQLESIRDRWGISYWVLPSHHAPNAAPIIERLAGR